MAGSLWKCLCTSFAILAMMSVQNVDAGVAVEYCVVCPANKTDGTPIERDCAEDMDPVMIDLEPEEQCKDDACFLLVDGDQVERGCVKDFKPRGHDTGPCDPMQLYLDKTHTEPFYCKCSQRAHCNDLNNFDKNPAEREASKHTGRKNSAPRVTLPGFVQFAIFGMNMLGLAFFTF
jgi:hypothetical protein